MQSPLPTLLVLVVASFSVWLFCAVPAAGQTGDYFFVGPDLVITPGSTDFEARYTLDSSQGGTVYAATFGICSDLPVVVPNTIVQGTDLQALNNGAGASFFVAAVSPQGGFTVAWISDFTGVDLVPPSAAFEMVAASYTPVGSNGDRTQLRFCSSLGNPTVPVQLYLDSVQTGPVGRLAGSVLITFGQFALVAPPELQVGTPFLGSVTLISPEAIEGFRFGLGHDPSRVAVLSVEPGPLLAMTHGGAGPDLFIADVAPAGGAGLTVECQISVSAPFEALPPGSGTLVDIGYDAIGPVGGGCVETEFMFRADLGSPPVPLEVQIAGVPFPAAALDTVSTIEAVLPPPTGGVTLEVASRFALPGTVAAVSVLLDTEFAVQAFSFSVVHDDPEFVLASIEPGTALAGIECGIGPAYFESYIPPGGTEGGSVLALLDFIPVGSAIEISPAAGQELVLLRYEVPSLPSTSGTVISLTDQLGNPPLAIEVTVDSSPVTPQTIPGELTIGSPFVRGRCNGDSGLNIADPIYLLNFLFPTPGVPPSIIECADACDANDDGGLNIADAITLLGVLFGTVGQLPEPSTCGADPTSTADPLGCDFSRCP